MANVVNNTESMKAKIEEARELTMSEKVKAHLANHAVEHYCEATGEDIEDVESVLKSVEKEDGLYWVYTCPVIGGVNADGKPNPTKEEWEKANKGAVRCDVMDSKQWYKKAVSITDATTVLRIVRSYGNYMDAKEKGKTRLLAKLREEVASAFLAGDMEKANKLAAEIKKLEK